MHSVRHATSPWAIVVAFSATLGIATLAQAGPAPFRNGELSIHVLDVDPISVPPSAPLASGVLRATRDGDSLLAVGLPAGVFAATGLSTPIDPPIEGVVNGVELTVSNPAAAFTSTGGGGGFFGGPMPLQGTLRICAFNLTGVGCPTASLTVPVPLSVVGAPGTYTDDFFLQLTVRGAAWTTAAIAIPAPGGSIEVSGGIAPAPGGYLAVEMVTPIFIETDLEGFEVVPAWATMSFEVPEPGLLLLGLGAVGTLVIMGMSRRRRS
jgi:hypothetical protein